MTRIRQEMGVAGAARATGATAVIDTFRAFTTAAVLFDRGIDSLVLTADVGHARSLARSIDALTCGEVHGRKPADFDLSNSPSEALRRSDLAGAAVVQRTSGGTRSVVAALGAGAAPVYAASLVVASATARALGPFDPVTLVSAGLHGTEPSEEDDLTAEHITALLDGRSPDSDITDRVARCRRAEELRHAPWAGSDDVELASTLDRYDFAMRAERTTDGFIELIREAT